MAEARAAKRAADLDAAEGTKVYASVGAQKGRKSVDFGDGKPVDVRTIDDVDVAYKGKDGKVHVVEVKNTANATTQASLPAQAKRLADWAKESGVTPPRAARYQIETPRTGTRSSTVSRRTRKPVRPRPAPRLRPSRTTVSAPGSPVRT